MIALRKSSVRRGLTSSRGFTLVETLVVLGVSLAMMAVGTQYVVRHTENMANEAAADHMQIVAGGAKEYARANETAILSTLASAPTASVSVAALKAQGYVPPTVAERNNYGQAYSIRFVKNSPTSFEGVVVTQGGETIKPLNKRKIAQELGAAGGHLDEQSMTRLAGSFDSWDRPLADFGIGAGEAELAYALFVEEAVDAGAPASSQYISRKSVAGMPELNAMEVDLDMGGHEVVGVTRLAAENVEAEEAIVEQLAAGSLEVAEGATFAGITTFENSTAVGPIVERTNAPYNAHIQYKTTSGSVFAGQGPANTFAVGGATDLFTQANQWFTVSSTTAKLHGEDIWTTGTFDPATKADKLHLHSATDITTGVLSAARIPNLNASKITAGILGVSRIPNLDASKIDTGVLDLARIPALPISKVSGLQGELNALLPLAGGTMTGDLSISRNNPSLSLLQNGVLGGKVRSNGMNLIMSANGGDGTVYLRPRGDTSTIGQVVITDSAFTYKGNAVWDAASFDPASKANVTHNHDASEITSGILSSTRIPNLAASKITSGTFNAARIPSLDASKITTGTLDLDRIPALPIAKVSGLQGELNALLPKSGGTMTGGISMRAGNRPLSFVSAGAGHSYMQWFVDESNPTARSAYLGFGSSASTTFSISNDRAGGSVVLSPGAGGSAYVGTGEIWHTGNFNPSSKANAAHNHDASNITSGVLSSARVPNLDASKISSGTFSSARIPALDAGKITTGTLGVDRIPTLPISKVAGLQNELNALLPKAGGTMTGDLNISKNNPGLNLLHNGVLGGRVRSNGVNIVISANGGDGTIYLRPRGDDSGTGQVMITDNAITHGGHTLWHSGIFDPASKANASHNHSAANITSGTLADARIPTLAISKISGLQTALDNTVSVTGSQTITGTKVFTDFVRSSGNTGWYNNTHGGGWYMTDSSWIRAYNNKNVVTGGTIQGGKITSTGNVEASADVLGRYLRPTSVASCNASCPTNGLMAVTSTGAALSCQSGLWKGYSCGGSGGGVILLCDTCPIGWTPLATSCTRVDPRWGTREEIPCP